MSLVLLGVVVIQHLQSKLHALHTLLHFCTVHVEGCLLFSTQLVCLRLCLGQCCQLLFKLCDLFLKLCRLGIIRVNLSCKFLDVGLLVCLLGFSLCHFLIAESLLRCIGLGFAQQLL